MVKLTGQLRINELGPLKPISIIATVIIAQVLLLLTSWTVIKDMIQSVIYIY